MPRAASVALLVIGLLAALLPAPVTPAATAAAAERIRDYVVRVRVLPDATLEVSETITAVSEGRRIRHGIYRDFPLYFRRPDGARARVGFEVLQVRRDGRAEEWFSRSARAHVRIYIGRKDTLLPAGVHTWTLVYRTTRQIRRFPDHDELYWNVTGNFWSFPIDHARVNVELPGSAPVLKVALYTGRLGEKGGDARILARRPGRVTAETTRALAAGEGFTIAVAFPKGVVAAPSAAGELLRDVMDRIGLWWLLAGSLTVTGYFLWAWLRVGRDPPRGAVYPRWEPPAGLSPAATAWLQAEARLAPFDPYRAFSAALTSLAVKGYVQLEKNADGHVRVIRQRRADSGLPPGERAIMDTLLGDRMAITLDRYVRTRIRAALDAFHDALKAEYRGRFLVRNRLWLAAGAVLALLVLAGFVFFAGMEGGGFLLVFIAIAALVFSVFVFQFRHQWRRLGTLPRVFLGGLALVVAAPFFIMPVGALFGLLEEDLGTRQALIAMAAMLSLPLAVIVFWFLLPRPTLAGRRAMDELAGLEMFLKVAEGPRLRARGAPAMSVRLFERFLPYAVALGLEEAWTAAFRRWLASATAAGRAGRVYRPAWYGGQSYTPENIDALAPAISADIAGDIAAAMPSASSSGVSGGGFSGGGGGGGGGGGW